MIGKVNLKEYDDSITKFSDWIPYFGLITPHIFINKDDSLMTIFSYDSKNITTDTTDIERLLKKISSGVGFWIDKNFRQNTTYCFIVWNPEIDKDNNILNYPIKTQKSNDTLTIFNDFIQKTFDTFKTFLPNVQIVKENDVLNVLMQVLTMQDEIAMPDMTLYLDCYLTQEHQYQKEDFYLKIDDYYLKNIRILGYSNHIVGYLLDYIVEHNILYRYTRRLLFLSEQDKNDTQDRYFKKWCNAHKSFLNYLCIPKQQKAMYIDNTLTIYSKDKGILDEQVLDIEHLLNENYSIITISKNYNMGDVWYATLPAMFRNGYNHSLVGLSNIRSNLLL